ncbi:hypothetical protein [Halorientalis halophila]|uniref:hypothetical protein n=1 Tax=Halorientalis halophila TaxID=3108499 RepID=UPI003009AE9F
MSLAHRLAPLAVALLLVLAGCGAGPSDGTATEPTDAESPAAADTPAATDDPNQTATPTGTDTPAEPANRSDDGGGNETAAYSVQVQNGTLPFDANRTLVRTQSLLGTDVEPRPVRIQNLSEWRRTLPRIGASPLNAALGFENVSVNWSQPTGATRGTGYVAIHPGAGAPGATERVLAHEFTHMVQYQANQLPWLDRFRTERVLTDQAKVYRALQEGAAVFTADAYADRYLDVQNNSAFIREQYEQGGASYQSALAPYLFGSQYVAQQVDTPANLTAVYQNPPRTTEQLLHNYTRAEEPEANLTVTTTRTGADWRFLGNNTLGELTVRHSLGTELSRDRATAAATGWGSDELHVFQNTSAVDRYGWAWIFQWDNSNEADEAAAALEEYESIRETDQGVDFETRRIGDETTALVFGDPQFVEAASVDGTTANVTVAVGS